MMEVLKGVLLLTFLAICWTITQGIECPVGWKGYNKSCYFFSNNTLNWNQAFAQCIALQSYLVEIEDSDENAFAASYSLENSYDNYYIGLSDRDKEGTWKWMTSGKPLGFSSWDSGEPNSLVGDEDCAHFRKEYPSTWNDVSCSTSYRYICEKDNINVCQSSSCQHGSTCDEKIGGFTCMCPEGYEGIYCEAEINECLSNPCQKASTCYDGVNSYLCVCAEGFKGSDCNEFIECSSNPCLNGARCIEGVKNHTCECVAGYNGTECENDINDCLPNPCKNGGKCTDGVNSYTCSCVSGYCGSDCSSDAWNGTPVPNLIWLLILLATSKIIAMA